MMEAVLSSETSVFTRTARRIIPEDGIRQTYSRLRDEEMCLYNPNVHYSDHKTSLLGLILR
jgi:hypothetical protein